MANRCVCCGEVIPEGWQVCYECENRQNDEERILIKLPFGVGATVYCIDNTGTKRKPHYEVKEYTVDNYTIGTQIGIVICSNDNEWKEICGIEDIGKSIFKTKIDAEKELEGM
jgi:DNA-directed RNA polymerase subunit N (RpoN/RPB10)